MITMTITTKTALNVRHGLIGAAVACTVVGAASANVTIANYSSRFDFEFQVSYMPDLDQKRATLPGNGCMFCVPTCMMNLFSYAAEWGFEDLEPGPGVWQADVSYSTMTSKIALLGAWMNTGLDGFGCDDGTDINGWQSGTDLWLSGFPFNYYRLGKQDEWCPQLYNAAWWAAEGAIVSLIYGRYNFNPAAEPILGSRTGGHCVTLVYTRADPPFGDLVLHVRNPSNNSSVFTQAPWAHSIYDVETMSVRQDWDGDSAFLSTEVTAINYDSTANKIRLFDAIYVLQPQIGYSWSGIVLNIDPLPFGDWTLPPPHQGFEPLPGFVFTDVARNLLTPTYSVLASEGPLTWLMEADPLTGDMELLATIPGATDIVVGRHGELFVLADTQLYQLNLEGQIQQSVALPYPCQAIAYRDTTDEIVLVSASTQQMLVFDTSDGIFVFEGAVPIPPTPDPSIAVRESDGAVAILVPQVPDLIYGVLVQSPGDPPLIDVALFPGLDATSVAFDDREHLVVATAGGGVKDYEPDPAGWWDWNAVSPSWYDAVVSVGAFRVSRSRTNFDPAINAVDDIQTPADELDDFGSVVYDCPGDFDNDQTVGVIELLAMLGSWGPCAGCPEDLDGDNFVGVTDLLLLLGLWGECAI